MAQGPFPSESVLALAAGLAEALAAIHAAGLVHRDLKPDNVLLAYDGPRVIDFGIARSAGASTLTSTGVLMGTLGFMSPEQVLGSAVGPPSDVFSLGSLLVFAATGEGPFGNGSAPQLLYRVAHETPSLAHVPPEARPLVERCLAAEPGQRPTPSELVAYLGAATPTEGWLAQTTALEIPREATLLSAAPRSLAPRSLAPRAGDTVSLQDATVPTPPGMTDPGPRSRGGSAMRRVAVVAVAVAVVVGLGAAYAVSHFSPHNAASPHNAPSSPSAPLQHSVATWSGGRQIDTAAALVSVSCASTKFCAAVDSGGSVYTYSGGSWSKPRPLSSGPLSWVSCPTAHSCVAASDGADTVYAYSGGSWSSPSHLIGDDGKAAHLTSVSCPTASFCVATGGRDAYAYSVGSWSQGVLLQNGSSSKFTSISCPSTSFCAAVDSGGRVHTYSGGSWSKPRSLSSGGLSWVSCPTARSCVATSDGDTLYAYTGGTWSSPSPLVGADGNPAHLTSVSCPTPSFCMATGGLNAYTYSGNKWKHGRMVHTSHQFASISCVSANFCAAVDSGGNVYTYGPPRSSLSPGSGLAPSRLPSPG